MTGAATGGRGGAGEDALAGSHIMVVEDEYILARQLVRALTQAGAVVVGPVPSVAQALAMLAQEPPRRIDAAILDVNLAGEKIYPVADLLQRRGVPFVFASGYDAAEAEPRFATTRYLVKPVTMKALFGALAAALAPPDDLPRA